MSQISAISAAATTASAAVQASSANADAGNTTQAQPDVTQLGLPPANLAQAASANTLNALLVTNQWGVDPASVAGVYGGAAADSSSLFGGNTTLLPILESLSPARAEQALALLGVQAPTASNTSSAASPTAGSTATTTQAASRAFLDQAATTGGSGPTNVDPLWGTRA